MTTLTFLTLFLGLTTGVHPVAVDVDGPVARVEMLLDGESCGVREEPPWHFRCDFGEELTPHDLEARAWHGDGDGNGDGNAEGDAEDAPAPVATAHQRVNLAPRQSAVEMTLARDDEGAVEALRLAWRSVAFPEPREVRVTLDGEPLPVDDPQRIPLPPLELADLHFAVAELTFPDGGLARTEVVFGGTWGDRVSTRNSAIPVLPGETKLATPEDAAGLLVRLPRQSREDHHRASGEGPDGGYKEAGGAAGGKPGSDDAEAQPQPVVPVAVEAGAADLVVVMDASAPRELGSLQKEFAGFQDRDARVGLEGDDRLFLLDPVPRRPAEDGPKLFITSPARSATQGGLAWQLAHFRYPEGTPQRLADAVALAAMQAAAGGRPRGVLLVLGPGARDDGDRTPQEVRRFLDRLRVPLEVWWIERPTKDLPPRERIAAIHDRKDRRRRFATAADGWGPIVEIGNLRDLVAAARNLRAEVARQRIVWVEGIHLPTEVALAEPDSGVRLLGGPAPATKARDAPAP